MSKTSVVTELVIPEQPTQLATVDAGPSLVGWLDPRLQTERSSPVLLAHPHPPPDSLPDIEARLPM